MSRTTRKAPQGWNAANVNEWWYELYLSFIRGHRPGKDVRRPTRVGGWYDWLDIPGRNCINSKRYTKRMNSKMRRREAKKGLGNYKEE